MLCRNNHWPDTGHIVSADPAGPWTIRASWSGQFSTASDYWVETPIATLGAPTSGAFTRSELGDWKGWQPNEDWAISAAITRPSADVYYWFFRCRQHELRSAALHGRGNSQPRLHGRWGLRQRAAARKHGGR